MYGSWEQYEERCKDQSETEGLGVQCIVCVAEESACQECQAEIDTWAILHYGYMGEWQDDSPGDLAKMVAAR